MSKDPRVMIKSRINALDISRLIIECSPKQMMSLCLDPNATYTIESSDGRQWNGMSPVSIGISRSTEDVILERYVPWLDGAREHLYNLAVWREGY